MVLAAMGEKNTVDIGGLRAIKLHIGRCVPPRIDKNLTINNMPSLPRRQVAPKKRREKYFQRLLNSPQTGPK